MHLEPLVLLSSTVEKKLGLVHATCSGGPQSKYM